MRSFVFADEIVRWEAPWERLGFPKGVVKNQYSTIPKYPAALMAWELQKHSRIVQNFERRDHAALR